MLALISGLSKRRSLVRLSTKAQTVIGLPQSHGGLQWKSEVILHTVHSLCAVHIPLGLLQVIPPSEGIQRGQLEVEGFHVAF